MRISRKRSDRSDFSTPTRTEVEAQLARVVASDSFKGAQRSTDFLEFVVAESLAGRADRLGGYTIGVEVFGRADDFDPQTDPIVRVEAGRLRRRLERHYLVSATDRVLIEVPKGGYAPVFSYRGDEAETRKAPILVTETSPAAGSGTRWKFWVLGLALSLVVAVLAWPAWRPETSTHDWRARTDPEVLALYEQAMKLRDPPLDPVLRWRLVEEAYRQVIERDPEFAGGYAGLAFVLTVRSWWGLSQDFEADARAALEAGRLAVEKDPRFGWAHATLGMALNLQGDHENSLASARRAVRLSPDDAYTQSLCGLIHTLAGEVDTGISLAREALRLDPVSPRTPYRNIAGIALYHAGLFDEAMDLLAENQRLGGPDGPHMAWYRAATLARLGRMQDAAAEVERARAMPFSITPRQFARAFRDVSEAEELLSSLESIGAETGESLELP